MKTRALAKERARSWARASALSRRSARASREDSACRATGRFRRASCRSRPCTWPGSRGARPTCVSRRFRKKSKTRLDAARTRYELGRDPKRSRVLFRKERPSPPSLLVLCRWRASEKRFETLSACPLWGDRGVARRAFVERVLCQRVPDVYHRYVGRLSRRVPSKTSDLRCVSSVADSDQHLVKLFEHRKKCGFPHNTIECDSVRDSSQPTCLKTRQGIRKNADGARRHDPGGEPAPQRDPTFYSFLEFLTSYLSRCRHHPQSPTIWDTIDRV